MNIIELAKQAGLKRHQEQAPGIDGVVGSWADLEKFAALVKAHERNECIKLVHEGTGEPIQTKTLFVLNKERKRIADAIRTRGTT
jgi:hypothetical protein